MELCPGLRWLLFPPAALLYSIPALSPSPSLRWRWILGENPWQRRFLGDGLADGIYRDAARVWRRDGRCAAIWGGVASIWGASTAAGGGHGRPPEPVLTATPRWRHGRRQGKRWTR
jgi:hypothetical protein